MVGDSMLYWLSRTIAHNCVVLQVGKATRNEKVRFAADAGTVLAKYSYPY